MSTEKIASELLTLSTTGTLVYDLNRKCASIMKPEQKAN